MKSETTPRMRRRAVERFCGGLGLILALLFLVAAAASAQAPAPTIRMARVPSGSTLDDPAAEFWSSMPPVVVPVLAQGITTPSLAKAAVERLDVRAAHDGAVWAVRIEWMDKTRSDRIVVDNFGDQVAVEVPMLFREGALPSPMMGNPGARVGVLQWRAAFQHDLQYGPPQLRDVYPNAMVDVYPDEVLRTIDARPYSGALEVGNPVSAARGSSVLDQMAEGFGTMTVKPEQHAGGQGRWIGNRWIVAITHPLSRGGPNEPDVRAGAKSAFAFAVWEGGNNEVGSRKAWAPWVEVAVAP